LESVMNCPKCGSKTVVIQLNEKGKKDCRVRGCNNCGFKFTTVEKVRIKGVLCRACYRGMFGRDGNSHRRNDNKI